MTLSTTLSSLEPLKHKINVIHGLFHKRAMGNGIHPAQTGGLLSGSVIQKGAIVRAGITVDQLIANRVGQDTALPSIVLACEEPMTGFHETNYSLAYSSHLSWQSPESPVPNELYPRWRGTACSRIAAPCGTSASSTAPRTKPPR
jgi:hypothetical protein